MAFHPHDLGNCRHVSKHEDQKDTKEEKFIFIKVKGQDPTCQFHKLAIKRIEE